jgi:hypothetical protein
MAGIFTPRHLFLINRLQQRGVDLNLEESLTQSYNPLRAALTAYFTVGELGALTYVVRSNTGEGWMEGFIQVRERRARPEADVLFIAPTLAGDVDPDVWHHLLTHVCQQAGGRGVERLFARLPEGSGQVHLFCQVGFNVYTREDIFCLNSDQPAESQPSPDAAIRPRCPADTIALQQLYAAIAPRLVQQAESITGRGRCYPPEVRPVASDRQTCVLEKKGEIVGCLTARPGRIGHWLYVLLHPQAYDQADALLAHGLAALRDVSPGPVYCSVREYQGGLRAVLQDAGFEPFVSRALIVKHTAVRVADAARTLMPALDKRADATTPTVSSANGQRVGSQQNRSTDGGIIINT